VLEPLISWCLGFVVPITLKCLLLCVIVMVVSILGVAVVLVWEQVSIILGKTDAVTGQLFWTNYL
jgi:hypothetical protein